MITNGMVMRPFVVFAIKVMPPGRRRLGMVKLAHGIHDARSGARPFQGRFQIAIDTQAQPLPSSQRAA